MKWIQYILTLFSKSKLLSCAPPIIGFDLIDPDRGVDIIRADVFLPISYSYFSLNPDHLCKSMDFYQI
jgi:hypothetical protein